jgi:hypothetical protein
MVQRVIIYGAEIWDGNRKKRKKLLATEMDYLKRSCRKTRLDRIRNETITEMITLIEMEETRWPRKVPNGVPQEKCKRGRLRRDWKEDTKEAMEGRDRAEEDCYRREGWRLGAEKRGQL